jgi:hypothetical protein
MPQCGNCRIYSHEYHDSRISGRMSRYSEALVCRATTTRVDKTRIQSNIQSGTFYSILLLSNCAVQRGHCLLACEVSILAELICQQTLLAARTEYLSDQIRPLATPVTKWGTSTIMFLFPFFDPQLSPMELSSCLSFFFLDSCR